MHQPNIIVGKDLERPARSVHTCNAFCTLNTRVLWAGRLYLCCNRLAEASEAASEAAAESA